MKHLLIIFTTFILFGCEEPSYDISELNYNKSENKYYKKFFLMNQLQMLLLLVKFKAK